MKIARTDFVCTGNLFFKTTPTVLSKQYSKPQ